MDTNLAALIALGAAGCTSQDKTFSSFSYAGAVGDPATTILAHLIFQAAAQDIHGWSFTDANGTTNAWVSGFSLGYTITVTPPAGLTTIVASKDQIDSGFIPNGTVMTDTQSAPAGLLVTNGTSTAAETFQKSYAGVTSITTSSVATIPAGSPPHPGSSRCSGPRWTNHPAPGSVRPPGWSPDPQAGRTGQSNPGAAAGH